MSDKLNKHFRPDIEGLRALAVLLVMFYHLEIPGITGGFIGVDVFFVLSGFVITQLLMRNLEQGKFQFRDFYARRIRRLVPIFLLVSTVTFFAISPFYIGDAYYIFAKSWIASLIGLSNIFYFQELSQYFSPASKSLSLLHTWSLAVEEQFYFIWSLGLFLMLRFGNGKSYLLYFVLLFIAALALSIYMAYQLPTAAFYLLPARLFEFLLGTGVALYVHRLPKLNRVIAEVLAWLGFLLILATGLLLDKHDVFPGLNALWPTLGTALIIYVGSQQQKASLIRLLSLPVMVFIGGLSYSLYLWHWPPIAFMHYQLIEITWHYQLLVIAATFICAWLGFHLVEDRFRRLPWSFKRTFFTFVFGPLIVIWLIQSTIRIADDLSFRIPQERRAIYEIIENNNTTSMYKRCFKGPFVDFNKTEACLFGQKTADGSPNAALIGDSHAISALGMIETLIEGSDTYFLLVTQASTAFFPTAISEQLFKHDDEKRNRNIALSEYLTKNQHLTVFLGGVWGGYTGSEQGRQYLLETLAWLKQRGHKVVFIGDVAVLPSSDFAGCLLKNRKDCSFDVESNHRVHENFLQFKTTASKAHPDVIWLDPYPLLCDEVSCQSVLNGVPLYRDESHLNNVGAKEIGKEYIKQLGNPLISL